MVTRDSVPALRRGIRRHFDATRKAHVLLGPERVIVLDEIAFAITECFDARRSVGEISGMLATRFESDAAVVEPDVLAFVAELVEKGLAVA
jgi:pyrroloquinoline quinone biosynthesis protein D